jgi:hypothetical protein
MGSYHTSTVNLLLTFLPLEFCSVHREHMSIINMDVLCSIPRSLSFLQLFISITTLSETDQVNVTPLPVFLHLHFHFSPRLWMDWLYPLSQDCGTI